MSDDVTSYFEEEKKACKIKLKSLKDFMRRRFKRRLVPGRTRPRLKLRSKRRNEFSYYLRYRRRYRPDNPYGLKYTRTATIRSLKKTKFHLDYETKLRKSVHN